MKIVVEKQSIEDGYILNIGDIIKDNSTFWHVIQEANGYILRTFDNTCGYTGHHDTLQSLTNSINIYSNLTLFKASEYELVLRKKKEK